MIRLNPKSRWFIVCLILVVVLWLGFVIAGQTLRHIAIRQIVELTDTQIEAHTVDFKLNGSVFIGKLAVRPEGRSRYDDSILKAERVYARFGIWSMLLLRPRLKEIRVRDFVFNAQYDLDTGQWNVAALKMVAGKGGGLKRMPVIHLTGGVFQYSRVSGGRVEVAAAVPFEAEFGSSGKVRDRYSFSATMAERPDLHKSILNGFWRPGEVTIDGKLSSLDVPGFKKGWVADFLSARMSYERDKDFSLELEIKDLLSTEGVDDDAFSLMETPFLKEVEFIGALGRIFERYRPVGLCGIELEGSGNLDRLSETVLSGRVQCKDISICYYKFPYVVEQLTGEIDFTEKSIVLNNLKGKHKDVTLFIDGWSKDFGPDRRYQIQVTSENMALDKDLYDALSARQKKFWLAFSPSGVAAIDYRIVRQSQTDRKKTLAVELLDAEAAYRGFSYPLENLTGRLFFDRDSVVISDVVSRVGEREIVIKGEVTATDTSRPVYDILIEANDVPLDSTLADGLTERRRRFYDKLNISGFADVKARVFTPKEEAGPVSFTADVYLKDAFLKVDDFPLAIFDVSAKSVIEGDLLRVENLTGRYGDGLVSVNGRIWPGAEDERLCYRLLLSGEQVQLDDELFGLLPIPFDELVSELEPSGKVSFIADLYKSGEMSSPDYKVVIDCLDDSIDFEHFGCPLKNITGGIRVDREVDTIELALDDVRVNCADDSDEVGEETSAVRVDGQVVLTDDGVGDEGFELREGEFSFVAGNLKVKGKTISELNAGIYYAPGRQGWLSKELFGNCYRGRFAGKFELQRSGESALEYTVQVGFDDIELEEFLSDSEAEGARRQGHTSGTMSGSLSVGAVVGAELPRIGRCQLRITDMEVGKLSPLAKLLSVLRLTEPKDYAFEQMLVDSYINHNRLFFEQFDLSGESLAFNGTGWMDLRSRDVDLTLTARGRRLAGAEPSLLGSLTEGLGRAVVRMEVTGDAYDPQVTTKTLPVIEDTLGIIGAESDGRD